MVAETLELPADLRVALERAVEQIVEIAHPQVIILFGSYAEGCAREDSDVDLLVVAETEQRVWLAAELREALSSVFGPREFDLIVVRAEDWPEARGIRGFITYEADRYGVKLYERAA